MNNPHDNCYQSCVIMYTLSKFSSTCFVNTVYYCSKINIVINYYDIAYDEAFVNSSAGVLSLCKEV